MKPNFEFRKSASLFAYRVEKECSIDRSIRHQSCPKIANLGDIKIFLKALCSTKIQGNWGMRQRETNPPAQLVRLFWGQEIHSLYCECELDSRSESCGWCKNILFIPAWSHRSKREVRCPLWKGRIQVSERDHSSLWLREHAKWCPLHGWCCLVVSVEVGISSIAGYLYSSSYMCIPGW